MMSDEMRAAQELLLAMHRRDAEIYKSHHHYGVSCGNVCMTHAGDTIKNALLAAMQPQPSRRRTK
jgi:hypothetical protein